ncbi:MAG: CARDB domain-containing protein, partial [Chitinophagales bacterium]
NSLAVGETATMDLVAFTLHATNIRMAFAEVVAADQTDSDSTPANNTVTYPFEDDEAQASAVGISQTVGDLRIAVTTNQTEFSVGDWVHYTVVLFNESSNPTGPFIVKANLSDGLQPVSFGGNGFFDMKSHVWVFPNDLNGNGILAMDIYTEVISLNEPTDIFFEILAGTNPDSDSTPNNDNGDFTEDEDDEVLVSISPYTGPNESDLELRVSVNTTPATSTSEPSFEAFIILKNRGPANNKEIWLDVELPEGIGNLEFNAPPHTAFHFAPNSTTKATWYSQSLANGETDILLITGTIEDETIPLTFYAEVKESPIPDPDSTPDNNSTQIPVEDDEGAFTIPPTNGTRPDLEAFVAEVTPLAVQPGEILEVDFEVRNIGAIASAASKVHIWLDDEPNGGPYHNEVELSLGLEDISALAVGETSALTRTYTIPNDFPIGEYTIYIKADANDEIDEDIETNVQFSSHRITIGGTDPNIKIRNFNVPDLVLGTTIELSCEILNNGEIAVPATTLKYYLSLDPNIDPSDMLIATDDIPAMNVGGTSQHSTNFDVPTDLTSNFYYVIFMADSEEILEESNEFDNKIASLEYIEDLAINLYLTNLRVLSDNSLSLYAEVGNEGFGTSSQTTMNYYLSEDTELDDGDIFLGDGLVAAVEAGTTTNTQQVFSFASINVPYGEYYVFFEVNPDQNVEETSYTDNIKFTRFTHVPPSNSTEQFMQYYGTGKGVRVTETNTGYRILGSRQNERTLKNHVLDVKTDEMGTRTSYIDYGTILGKIIRTSDNGYIEVSSTSISSAPILDPSDILITKRNSLLGPVWTKFYNLGNLEYGRDIYETSDGGFVVTGYTTEKELFIEGGIEYERTLSSMVVLRIDVNGNELWFNKYEMPELEDVAAFFKEEGALVTQTNDGNFAVLVLRHTPAISGPTGLVFNGRDVRIYRISASGVLLETPVPEFGDQGAYHFPEVIKPTSDGGYVYVTNWGYASSKSGQISDVEKVGGMNGDWSISRSTSQFGTTQFNNVLENDEGNFIAMGIFQPFNSEPQHLFHVQPDGTEFDDFDIDRPVCDMIQTSDGGYALTGIHNDQIFLKKIPEGDIQVEGVDIELDYTVDVPTYRQWQKVNYTLTATNTGTEAATNLVISDPIPFGMAFTSKIVSTGTYNLWHQTWTIPQLAAGETATLDITLFTLINDATIVKFAQVKSLDQTDEDSTPNNNNTTIPQEDDETAVSISPIGGGGGKNALDNPIAQAGNLKLYNLFPVPADDHINLVFGTDGFHVNVLLYDVNGRLLKRQSLQVNRGEN